MSWVIYAYPGFAILIVVKKENQWYHIRFFLWQVAKISIQTAIISEYTCMVLLETTGGKIAEEAVEEKEVCSLLDIL